jgi:hypothetical protein
MSIGDDGASILRFQESTVNLEAEIKTEVVNSSTTTLTNLQKNKFRSVLGLKKLNVTMTDAKLDDQEKMAIIKDRALDELFDERAKEMKIIFWLLTIYNCYE